MSDDGGQVLQPVTGADRRKHVGARYLDWDYYDAPNLTPAQRARVLDAFAAEFEALSPLDEPIDGWGADMAYLCRRSARRHRGEPVDEYRPRWERDTPTEHNDDAGEQPSEQAS